MRKKLEQAFCNNDNKVIFGKNSDRPTGEGQSIRRYPAMKWFDNSNNNNDENEIGENDDHKVVKCMYITIPQVHETYAILISQIDWYFNDEINTRCITYH